ncbi:hypothetical protein [uncultured Shewanella sp.]|uniref:hypothetical protein n=1 Tax=uncultured Shewanella sp. TaxID=173975 RepID=UPI002613BE63|nr:hypothetical protein [uncultured Shewanella sp.]
MVNIIRKVIAISTLLVSSSVFAEVSHVSINQTLFEVGESADFRVNVVAADVDDVRFYLHDGDNEERLSVEALNTFMLNVTGDRPVLSSNVSLVVHEYLDGEWQKRQQFPLALTSTPPTSTTQHSVSENNIEKQLADKDDKASLTKADTEITLADNFAVDDMANDNLPVEVANTPNAGVEGNNAVNLSEANALNASSIEGHNAVNLSEVNAASIPATGADIEGVVGTTSLNGTNITSANVSEKSSESLLSVANMTKNEESLAMESFQSSSVTQTNSVSSVNNIDTNQIASQQAAFKDETILVSNSEEDSVKELSTKELEFEESQEGIQVGVNDNMNSIDSNDVHVENKLALNNREPIAQTDVKESSEEITDLSTSLGSVHEEGEEEKGICPILVAKDETLWKIDVRYHKQWGVGLFGGALALFEANPSAFNKGSIHGLKAGARLTCPSHEILAKYQDESLAERFFLAM